MTTREYGLLISAANRYGTEYVTVKMMIREEGKDYPCNPDTSGEPAYYNAPPHLAGLYLDGFGFDGHVMTGFNMEARYIGYEIDFTSVYSIDERKVGQMAKTFKRLRREFAKERPSEHGEVLVALARAFKLTFCCWTAGNGPERSMYSDNRWRWATIPEGRDYFRRVVAEA